MESPSIEKRTFDPFGIGMGQSSCLGMVFIWFPHPIWFEEIVVGEIAHEPLEISVRFTGEAGSLTLPVGEVVAQAGIYVIYRK